MTAIFPALVTVDVKFFPALGALECVHFFSLNLVKMLVPPHITAFVTAEPFPFLLGDLPDFPSAVFATCDFLHNLDGGYFHISAQVIPAAKGLHGIERYAKRLGNLAVAVPGSTQLGDLYFLIIGHSSSAPSERGVFL